MWWFISPTIVFGNDALEHLRTVRGTRAPIVTEIRRLGFVDEVSKYLTETGKQIHVFDQVEAEPSPENVAAGALVANNFHPDLIVALAGGSRIDAAKAVWTQYEHPELPFEEVSALTELGPRKARCNSYDKRGWFRCQLGRCHHKQSRARKDRLHKLA
jgi:alcohol dehydrogenase class IV